MEQLSLPQITFSKFRDRFSKSEDISGVGWHVNHKARASFPIIPLQTLLLRSLAIRWSHLGGLISMLPVTFSRGLYFSSLYALASIFHIRMSTKLAPKSSYNIFLYNIKTFPFLYTSFYRLSIPFQYIPYAFALPSCNFTEHLEHITKLTCCAGFMGRYSHLLTF